MKQRNTNKIKAGTLGAALTLSAALLIGCGKKEDENKATPELAVTSAPVAIKETASAPLAVTVTPVITKAPEHDEEAADEPLSYEESWTYHIVQSGYYNAAASWDEDGNLIEGPNYTAGEEIYYNDCDEYYDNFVAKSNVFSKALLSLDDINAHSSDNSMKVNGRPQESSGFSGFALRISEDNVLDIEKLNGREVTLGLWVYYTDDFETGVPDVLTFAVWSNLNPEEDEKNEKKTPEPAYYEEDEDMDKDQLAEIKEKNDALEAVYKLRSTEENKANELGFYKLTEVDVPYRTWKYIEVTTTIDTESSDPLFAIATLGEGNRKNITYYNPFYVDDIILSLNN